MKTLIRNKKGFSLAEVMVAVGITGGLALTISRMMENSAQNTKQIEAKAENINLKAMIQNILTDPVACDKTFGTIITQPNVTTLLANPSNKVTVPSIKDKANNIVFSTASTNISPLTITGLQLTNLNTTTGTADLLVKSTFRRSSTQVQEVKPAKITLSFLVNNNVPASPTLTGCSSTSLGGGEWKLSGNAATVNATDYIGTSDNVALNFRVNNQKSGRIDLDGSTFFGRQSGEAFSPAGVNNINTAFGYGTLAVLTGSNGTQNSAFGYKALASMTGQQANTAIGHGSLENYTVGHANTAVGANSMNSLTNSGSQNTCLGTHCMRHATGGSGNIGVGGGVFMGSATVHLTGDANLAIGYQAGGGLTSGNKNIFIGSQTGNGIGTGSNNIIFGERSTAWPTATSNTLYIETTGALNPLIGGNFSTRNVNINGKLMIESPPVGAHSHPANLTGTPDLKLHVRGGLTILDQEPWKDLAFGSTEWASCGGPTNAWGARYFRDSNGIVHLRGCVQRVSGGHVPRYGIAGWVTPAIVLPPGYQPLAWGPIGGKLFKAKNGPSATYECLLFHGYQATGTFSILSSEEDFRVNETCFLNGISFKAEN